MKRAVNPAQALLIVTGIVATLTIFDTITTPPIFPSEIIEPLKIKHHEHYYLWTPET